LIQQANAFVELGEKCQVIFKAQRAMMEIIPEDVDVSFLSEDHQSEYLSNTSHALLNLTNQPTCSWRKNAKLFF